MSEAPPSDNSDPTTAAADAPNRSNTNTSGGVGDDTGADRQRNANTTRTLDDVMREPSRSVPDVVVLESLPEPPKRKNVPNPKEDLWLSTVDGSPIVPLHVGEPPRRETFYVHRHILLKCEYFKKALCGEFKEAEAQSIDLPEENPAIFHFLVAYLYEGKYEPIRPAASVLAPEQDEGRESAADSSSAESDSDSDSASSVGSTISARLRRRRDRDRLRRERREWERAHRKRPGAHRPSCGCPQCVGAAAGGPPCWSCRAPRVPPRPPPPYLPYPFHARRDNHHRRHARLRERGGRAGPPVVRPPPPPDIPPPLPPAVAPPPAGAAVSDHHNPDSGRIASEEDLRTWLLAYELNLDVYILANRFLLEGFKEAVARATVDMLETAGADAAVAEVLYLCRKLYDGLPATDPLLAMIFARVGFLQPWRGPAEKEASAFLAANPDIATMLLREMAARREDEVGGRFLPSMVRPGQGFGSSQPQSDPLGRHHRLPNVGMPPGPPVGPYFD